MFLWVYDIPTWLLFVLIVIGFSILGVGGLFATRPVVRWVIGDPPSYNEGVDVFIGAVALLYGLIAGLIAVAVWEQYASIDARVNQEASAMGALYRLALEFPEPTRGKLSVAVKDLTYETMTHSWELQRRGATPTKPNPYLNEITNLIFGFKPKDARETNVQQSAETEYERIYELRRQRLYDVSAGLPPPLYAVVFIGGVLTIILTYFLVLERSRLHALLTLVASAMIGLVVFMIVVMDHPFRGDVSIGPEAFVQAHDVLMGGGSESAGAQSKPIAR